MALGLYSLIVGIIIGFISSMVIRGIRAWPRWSTIKSNLVGTGPYLLTIVMLSLIVYLVIFNWGEFSAPKTFSTWKGYEQVFLSNRADEVVLVLGGFLAAAGILSFIIRIPFSNWQQIKVFGLFEATRIRQAAKDELAAQAALNEHKIILLNELAGEAGYKLVEEHVTATSIYIGNILKELATLMEKVYTDGLEFTIRTGYYYDLNNSDAPIPKKVIEHLEHGEAVRVTYDGWESQIFMGFDIAGVKSIMWARSTDYVFQEYDRYFWTAIQRSLDNQVSLYLLQTTSSPSLPAQNN